MNKLYADGKHGKMVICVLEPGNIHKLIDERKPIHIDLNEGPYEKGLPAKLSVEIFFSETPVADAKQFAEMVSPEGRVEDRRTAVSMSKRPHCPQCFSIIEQLGVWRSDQSPVWIVFCVGCGRTLGTTPPIAGLEKAK